MNPVLSHAPVAIPYDSINPNPPILSDDDTILSNRESLLILLLSLIRSPWNPIPSTSLHSLPTNRNLLLSNNIFIIYQGFPHLCNQVPHAHPRSMHFTNVAIDSEEEAKEVRDRSRQIEQGRQPAAHVWNSSLHRPPPPTSHHRHDPFLILIPPAQLVAAVTSSLPSFCFSLPPPSPLTSSPRPHSWPSEALVLALIMWSRITKFNSCKRSGVAPPVYLRYISPSLLSTLPPVFLRLLTPSLLITLAPSLLKIRTPRCT